MAHTCVTIVYADKLFNIDWGSVVPGYPHSTFSQYQKNFGMSMKRKSPVRL